MARNTPPKRIRNKRRKSHNHKTRVYDLSEEQILELYEKENARMPNMLHRTKP